VSGIRTDASLLLEVIDVEGPFGKTDLEERRTASSARAGSSIFAIANGERQRRQFDSRKEADAFRITVENEIRAGTFRHDAAKFTVKDAALRFLEHCEGRRQRGERMTRQNYNTMDGHIGNYICRDPNRHKGKGRPVRLGSFDGGIGSIKLSAAYDAQRERIP